MGALYFGRLDACMPGKAIILTPLQFGGVVVGTDVRAVAFDT